MSGAGWCCANLAAQSKVICGSLFTFGFYFLAGSNTIEAQPDGQQIEAALRTDVEARQRLLTWPKSQLHAK